VQPEAKSEKVQQRVDGTIGQAVGWVIWLVVVFAILGGAIVWWDDNHYSSEFDNAFLSNCEAQPGASASYCGCALEQVHERYRPKEAQQVLVSGSSAITSIASYCVGQ
jgi:hypothetical protein